jgi:hypothetical protein
MSVLPNPTILQKIKELHADGPEDIMSRTERIARERRHQEMAPLSRETFSPRQVFHAIAQSAFLAFDSRTPRQPVAVIPYGNDRIALGNDWIAVGNDLKRAILEYMAANGLDEDKLGLTAQERQSLRIRPLVPLPAPPAL